jgi:hypothetical protein
MLQNSPKFKFTHVLGNDTCPEASERETRVPSQEGVSVFSALVRDNLIGCVLKQAG